MEAENWYQVKEILELAIEQPPDRREQFISERCSGDAVLRSKVDSLISSYERVGSFMEDGAIGSVAEMFASSKNDFQSGDRLGRYRVVRVLGEGGMGKVYLAEDLDLHRPVAIKVLRDDLWWYKQARQRLMREARSAARLDHPNICAIYEVEDNDERSFIVMQYIEGETLADVMAHGGLSMRESVGVALQIADALAEAHSNHIIHRDIKPANIIINEKRQVKVLDFGLAKSIEPESEENEKDLSSSGAVMGTVPYMSPEQLRGKTVDGRSDIFSFGALLYEMVSGRQAFRRENNAETISAILNEPPDLSLIPHRFRPVIERSLKKKAGDRYQSISEMATDLRGLVDETLDDTAPQHSFLNWFGAKSVISTAFRRYFSDRTGRPDTAGGKAYYRWQDSDSDARTVRLTEPVHFTQVTGPHPLTIRQRPILMAGIALLILLTIPVLLFWFIRPQSDPGSFDDLRVVRLVEWKEAGSTVYLGYSSSHNGKMIAYSTKQEGPNESIYVKPIPDGDEARVTKDQWNNYSPIWSPDDQQLAFVSLRNNADGIYTSPFLGGATTLVKPLDDGTISLRHWSNDGTAIYYEFDSNLFRLDLTTRDTQQVTSFKPSKLLSRSFAFSPNEDSFVYCDVVDGQTDLWVRSTRGGVPARLTNDTEVETTPSWHPDGKRILYSVVRDGYTQINFANLDGRQQEQITRGEGEHQLIDVSAEGKNIFYTTWEDRSDVWGISVETAQEFQVASGKESEFWPDVSPDGKSILYEINSAINPKLSTSDFAVRSTDDMRAKTVTRVNGYDPRWLPDSRHIAFLRWRGPEIGYTLWTADIITWEERLVVDQKVGMPDIAKLPYNRSQTREFSWSPDGGEVVYLSKLSGTSNVYKKTTGKSDITVLSENSDHSVTYYCPLFSPDGKRIAYISVRKQAGEGEKAISRVWIEEAGITREIYSTVDGLRLLGWQGNDRVILELSSGVDKDGRLISGPFDVRLIQLSIAGIPKVAELLRDIYADSAALSADGQSVAFTARRNDRDDVFVIPASGGAPRKVSSNNDPRVFFGSLAWAPDGKNIYFDKQESVNTISMFEILDKKEKKYGDERKQ